MVGAGLKNEIRAVISGRSWGQGASCDANFFNGSRSFHHFAPVFHRFRVCLKAFKGQFGA